MHCISFLIVLHRLGSVGQDTFLCLWELTEDVIRQGLRFSAHYHHANTTNGRHPSGALSVISSTSAATSSFGTTGGSSSLIDGGSSSLEKSRTVPRSSAGSSSTSKKRAFLSSFRSSLPHPSRHAHSDQGEFSGKSSVLSESGCASLSRDGVNGSHQPSISSRE